MKNLIWVMGLAVLASAGARAGIIVTLDNPSQSGGAGQTLSFFGTIANNSADTDPNDAIYLNSDSINLALSNASNTLIDGFANTPVNLAGGQSSGDIDLFNIELASPQSDPFGTYAGTYTLLGGADGGADTAQDILAQVSFSVITIAPEPSSFSLIGCALLLGLLAKAWRRSLVA